MWERDLSRCFRCQVILHRGRGGYSVHHRQPRGMGGSRNPALNSPANLLLLCGSGVDGCHGWIESNREKAKTLGLLIPVTSSLSPEDVRVLRWGAEWVRLLDDGMVLAVSG